MDRLDRKIALEPERNQPMGDANTKEIEIQLSDYQWTDIYKDYDLYLAARNGDLKDFARILDRVSAEEDLPIGDVLCSRISPKGNTFLHVAAKHGNCDVVTYITAIYPPMIFKKNFSGDTALHLAAEFGDESTVKSLVLNQTNEPDKSNLLRAQNERGNTALHQAIINRRPLIAEYLIRKDPVLLYYINGKGEYGLYLAAKANCVSSVASILQFPTDQARIMNQFKKKSPIKAAISNKNIGIVETILVWNPSLIKFRDDQGRTPLHYASSLGDLDVASYLLKAYAPNAPQKDNNGLLPIHLATIKGHIDIISLFLRFCPDPEELLDRDGRNILHIAAKSGRYNVVRYILNNPDLAKLINMKDKDGNVPLHLATINWHPTIVSFLTWDERVDVKSVNEEGVTALDAAEDPMGCNPSYRQCLTWSALKSAGTPRSISRKTAVKKSSKSSSPENYRERIHTLLVVSTLVATITFAAGFTVPGGYNSSAKDLGMATMLGNPGFYTFVFCDSVAMYCAIVVAVTLIWAQVGDLNLVLIALNLALPLLGFSLAMMSMAFTAGMYLVVSKLRWLGTTVFVLGFSFLAILFFFLAPLCMPLTFSNKILRHISYYPFCFLVFVTKNHSKHMLDEWDDHM